MHWATPEERRALGQARRKQVGRHQHEALHPKARPATALELVARSMRGRVPDLIQLKYHLMAESPFGYFRGAAPVMAADLAQLPSTGIVSQLCGDAHVRNLGAFASPDGRLVFDINDFDETIRGPFEWDLKRMAASLVLAGRAAGHKDGTARRAAEACVERYATQMRAFAHMPQIEVNRFQVHRIDLAKPVHDALSKAERATPQHTFEQLTVPVSSRPLSSRSVSSCRCPSNRPCGIYPVPFLRRGRILESRAATGRMARRPRSLDRKLPLPFLLSAAGKGEGFADPRHLWPEWFGSSASAALEQSLVSRLLPRLDTAGSTLFQQTWKRKGTPLRRRYWEHTASARRTSGSGCTSVPSPHELSEIRREGDRDVLAGSGGEGVVCRHRSSSSGSARICRKHSDAYGRTDSGGASTGGGADALRRTSELTPDAS